MNMLVSIIIPVYNKEKFLDTCIKSVLSQTHQNIEVILINDGSTDHSLEIISKYGKDFSEKIRIIEKENEGVSVARNYGLKAVNGKYVAFLDADDYLEPKYLEILLSTAEKYTCNVVCSGQYKVDEEGNIIKHIQVISKNGKCLTRRLNFAGKLYRTEYLNKWNIDFPNGKVYEDNYFNIQTLFLSDRNYFLNYSGYFQVVNEGSITSKPIKVESLPLEEWKFCIQKVIDNCEKEVDLELFEFTLLSFFTYFLLIRNRKREYLSNENKKGNIDSVLKMAQYCENVINVFFPKARSNKYASVCKYTEIVFIQRLGVKIFAWLCYYKKLEKFTQLFYKIAG